MADVTGRIGDNDVSLDNAATETTLRALLMATTRSSKDFDRLLNLAAKAGMNPKDIDAANTALKSAAVAGSASSASSANVTKSFKALNVGAMLLGGLFGHIYDGGVKTVKHLGELSGSLMTGSSSVTSFVNAFEDLPVGLGTLAKIIGKVIDIQEQELNTYRNLTKSGVNFAGSLTDMRTTATSLGLTLDQFGGLLSQNSDVLARMGTTVDQGARSFVNISTTLRKSPIGDQLLALGVGFEEMNQGVMNYLRISGGANAARLKDTKAMAESAAEYIKQQDMLSRLTGKSVEQQQKLLEEEAANAAFQNYLLTLDDKEREKALASFNIALQQGGKGAADAMRGQLMGLPPMTEAGRQFVALGENSSVVMKDLADAVKDPTKSLGDLNKGLLDFVFAMAEDGKKFAGALGAAGIAAGGEFGDTISTLLNVTNLLAQKNIKTQEDMVKLNDEILKKRLEQEKSQAALLAQAQKDLNTIGTELQKGLAPILKELTPIVTNLVQEFTKIVKENMPAITAGAKLIADELKEFSQNLFTEEGRNKIMNDLTYFFELLMIEVKNKILLLSDKEAELAKKELNARKDRIDAEAKLAAAQKDAANALAIEKLTGESEADFQSRLKQEQEARQATINALESQVTKSQKIEQGVQTEIANTPGWFEAPAVTENRKKYKADVETINNEIDKVKEELEKTGYNALKFWETNTEEQETFLKKIEELKEQRSGLSSKYFSDDPNMNVPGFASGGIVSGPKSGFPAMLHGTEAIIPLGSGRVTKESLPETLLSALSGMNSSNMSNTLNLPEPLKDLIKKVSNTEPEVEVETEATKSVIESTNQLENVAELLSTLNKQTAEMLEHIKISAEFDRRNLDALNGLNQNAFIRA
jgi:hypothetical protein